ncbi:DUF4411 family protein [Solimonas variicoloris]|uniref:DUF4411 family protein n=1 Tax=Solimonas variicoloris TaxID=254408 RepID=UPI000378464A|nr:DUF4411 family protein [Solimonas variicoloris]
MTPTDPKFVLDTNVFVQAHRAYYAFDIAPGFWASVLTHAKTGGLVSIDRVHEEVLNGGKGDALEDWVKKHAPKAMFASSKTADIAAEFAPLMQWVQSEARFTAEAKAEFAVKADGWLIAYAKKHGLTLVTHEGFNPDKKNKVLIPVVCKQFGVSYTDTFGMLRALKVQFDWKGP